MPSAVLLRELYDAFDVFDVGVVVVADGRVAGLNASAAHLLRCSTQETPEGGAVSFHPLDPQSRTPLNFSGTGAYPVALLVDIAGGEHTVGIVRLPEGMFAGQEVYLLAERPAGGGGGGCDGLRNRRVEVLGKLCDGIWHDFNNMLGGIMGCAELLASKLAENELLHRLVTTILESARNAATLNRKLLSLSTRAGEGEGSFHLHQALADATDILRRGIDRRVELRRDFCPSDIIIAGDYTDFVCLILMFALAARESMPHGGSIIFSTGLAAGIETEVPDGRYACLRICDSGQGIPARVIREISGEDDSRRAILDPAWRSIAGAAAAVREFGGDFSIRSEVGRGAEISLFLPLAGGGSCPLEERGQQTRVAVAHSGVVLVIDDESLMRAALCEMLRSIGYEVIEAADGEEGVRLYRQHQTRIDCVIIDMVMPRMNGRETYLSIRSYNPGVKAIIVSGFLRDYSASGLMADGIRAVLRKPFTMATLEGVLRGALQHKAQDQQALRQPEAFGEARALRAHSASGEGRGMATLLVEDDEIMREVIANVLEERGYSVVALGSGSDADLLLRGAEQFSLCLFDLRLPGVDGLQLCRQIKTQMAGQPVYVIIMTGQEAPAAHKSALQGGADDFIAKPFTLDLLSVRLDIAETNLHNSRKRLLAEKALRESEERMALAINTAELGIWELDRLSGQLVVSDLWLRITGCPFDCPEGPGGYLLDNTHPEDIARVRADVLKCRHDQTSFVTGEFRLKIAGRGYCWMHYVGRYEPEGVSGEGAYSGFFQDITARKHLELSRERQRKTLEDMVMERTEELVRINQELVQEMEARSRAEKDNLRQQRKLMDTEKLASLGTLVSGVGHEINNPTQFIMLNMPFLKGAWESALPVLDEYDAAHPDFRLRGVPYGLARERLPVMANDILAGAERIEKIVRELKDYARQGMDESFERVDLRRVADSAQTLLAHFIRQHTDNFALDLPPQELAVMANPTRIEQVMINLVQNSCLALEDKARRVTLRLADAPERGGTLIVVEDEGHGIEDRHLRHLTDPFFTTRQSCGGTGLGLAICERIVHNHKGEMHISSVVGKGTRVEVFLPYNPGTGATNG